MSGRARLTWGLGRTFALLLSGYGGMRMWMRRCADIRTRGYGRASGPATHAYARTDYLRVWGSPLRMGSKQDSPSPVVGMCVMCGAISKAETRVQVGRAGLVAL
ncbi:hypothetical protein B0H14DRAFT_2564460 [Mycena olivaceomarginata]|nr:hypothetical protein B0H14DRAFT_2564460 [Mycena olivaceomarginata]